MRSVLGRCLVLAMAVHGTALGYMSRSRETTPHAPLAREEKPLEVTIEIASSPEERPRDPQTTEAAEPSRVSATSGQRGIVDPRTTPPSSSASPGTETLPAAPPASSGSAADDTDARAARARGAVASLFGGGPSMVGPITESSGSPAREQVPKDKAGRILRDALGEHDREVGLGAGGPVVEAGRTAALSANAPSEGVATYQVITDAAGNVTDVRLLDANGSGWDKVGASMLGSLRGRKLRVPLNARGLSVTLRLEARFQLPSGAKDYKKGVVPGGFSADFDLSDVGAKQVRTVRSRVLAEAAL